MEEELKSFFAQRTKRYITDKQRLSSAVLIPIYRQDGEYRIVFIKRTMTVKVHKGQISYAGGTREKRDKNLLDTALREAEEEIGLRREDVTLLGEMDDEITTTSSYIVTPFVAMIPWPYRFTTNKEEVEKVISIPVKALLDKSCCKSDTEIFNGEKLVSFTYNYRGTVIWGATARILNKLLEVIKSVIL